MKEGDTLIFLDEVQECSDVLTLVKFLLEGTSYDVILSGSLLGLDAFPARSLPVGYLQIMDMYPLDFEEFCWARGVPAAVLERARQAVCDGEEVPDFIHEMLIDEFYRYLLVGGMPDTVRAFVDSNDLVKTRNSQRAIVDLYECDIAKYVVDKTEARQIEMVYESVPEQAEQALQVHAPWQEPAFREFGNGVRLAGKRRHRAADGARDRAGLSPEAFG